MGGAVNARERLCQIGLQVCIGPVDRCRARNDDVIESGARKIQEFRSRSLEPPSCPIAHDGLAYLLADGEAEPGAIRFAAGLPVFRGARPRLEHECWRAPSQAAPDPEELRSTLECRQPHGVL